MAELHTAQHAANGVLVDALFAPGRLSAVALYTPLLLPDLLLQLLQLLLQICLLLLQLLVLRLLQLSLRCSQVLVGLLLLAQCLNNSLCCCLTLSE